MSDLAAVHLSFFDECAWLLISFFEMQPRPQWKLTPIPQKSFFFRRSSRIKLGTFEFDMEYKLLSLTM